MGAREFWQTVHRLTAFGTDGHVRGEKAARRPKVVVLCGSTRYWEQLYEANLYETAAGRIVLAPGCILTVHKQFFGLHCTELFWSDEIHSAGQLTTHKHRQSHPCENHWCPVCSADGLTSYRESAA